ncbi:CCA tRNA nucleotidyltransferase [Aquisediminimonas profunda]|uniref:CCA tRNA nucleotidyltransferase n=1 Tax=Aquisediminimonas profunda TaxID=1550733 RepID=UPI001C625992|nr:CCA tRNA nucleotidyltransferase [Aquisediminimonas profunda]
MGTVTLPDRVGLRALARILGSLEGATRLVGGAVRDMLAGEPVKDIDLATKLSPQEVIACLQKARIKAVPTGIAHGTVTAVLSSGPVEVTTLRRDVSTDGRRATIAYTDDWREDAARRDFTINALYADPETGELFDYFGGESDLAAGLVRFIGEPLQRIAEDHLRILRFFRFHARFGKGAPDPASLKACSERANDLMALSRERIADELLKLLALSRPVETVELMLSHGIFLPVLPEISTAAGLTALVATEDSPDAVRRLASLLPANGDIAGTVAKRLKLSKLATKRLVLAAGREETDAANPRALAYRIGLEAARDRLMLGNHGNALADLNGWTVPTFPLTGGAIVARGIKAGPEVARLLQKTEAQWIAEGFPDEARALAIADEVVGQEQSKR